MLAHLRLILLFMAASLTTALAQTVVPLWNGPAPQSLGTADKDIPTLTVFLPANATAATPAVVICPGGGYAGLAFEHEGTNVAKFFQAHGVAGLVLKYRLPVNGYRHPVPMHDVQRALRLARSHAADWKINPAKVGVMGFSAGGHLAATADTHFDAGDANAADPVDKLSCRPDFGILVYGVISMQDAITHQGSKQNLLGPNPDPALVENLSNEKQITAQTPPTILVHAVDDNVVPVANSRLMYAALQKAGIPSRLDEYPTGGHGFGYGANPDHSPAGWLDKVYDWLKGQSMVP